MRTRPASGGPSLVRPQGELPMQNALLVGLSRQVALARELDVVANNIANLNTTGFKSDGAVFEEFISPTATRRQLYQRRSARVSFVHDRATWIDLSQGTTRTHRQFTRRGNRRPRIPGRADSGRRTLHAQRRVCRSTTMANSLPARAIRCWANPDPSLFNPKTETSRSARTAQSAYAKAIMPND